MAKVVVNRQFGAEYRLPQNHRNWTREAGRVGTAAIRSEMSRGTGRMQASIRTRTRVGIKGPIVEYSSPLEHTVYQEVGTGIHGPMRRYITPTVAKALSWINNGKRVFAKKVKGSKPQRFFRRGMERTFGRENVRYYGARGGPRLR